MKRVKFLPLLVLIFITSLAISACNGTTADKGNSRSQISSNNVTTTTAGVLPTQATASSRRIKVGDRSITPEEYVAAGDCALVAIPQCYATTEDSGSSSEEARTEVKVITIDELLNDFQENQTDAMEKYQDQSVQITGRLIDIGQDNYSGATYLLLGQSSGVNRSGSQIQCYGLRRSDLESVMSGSSSQEITVKCDQVGMHNGDVIVDYCTLVN